MSLSFRYDILRRSIILSGPIALIMAYKILLNHDLSSLRSSVLVVNFPLSTRQPLDDESRLCPSIRTHTNQVQTIQTAPKIIAIRKTQDFERLNLWMAMILPFLSEILDDSIGDDYSVSFVREGGTEQRSNAVIRIESPAMPAPVTKKVIRQTLDRKCGMSLERFGVYVWFLKGALRLLGGKDFIDPRDEEDGNTDFDQQDLPWHARFWELPGMGASIGLLCTDEQFATLGNYIEIDNETFILTVDHFVTESYLKAVADRTDQCTLTSPALAKVKSMRRDIKAMCGSLDGKLKAELRNAFPEDSISPEDYNNLPSDIRNKITTTSKYLSELTIWLKELEKDDIEFRIGSLVHRCVADSTAALCESSSSVAFDHSTCAGALHRHRLDWALFKVDRRMGTNHHRYRFNREKGGLEYELDVQRIIPGPVIENTGVVEANTKVYFEGQTSGRVHGEINAALGLVRLGGCKTLEHHIVIDEDCTKQAAKYHGLGDSGAAVLRTSDNALLGLVWACQDNQPVFTPIHTIFQDIKDSLRAAVVQLPSVRRDGPPDHVNVRLTNEATYSCGNEIEYSGKRPYRLPELDEFARAKEDKRILDIFGGSASFTVDGFLQAVKSDAPKSTRYTSPVPALSLSRSPSPEAGPASRSQTPVDSPHVEDALNPFICGDQDSDRALESIAYQRSGKATAILEPYQSARPCPWLTWLSQWDRKSPLDIRASLQVL